MAWGGKHLIREQTKSKTMLRAVLGFLGRLTGCAGLGPRSLGNFNVNEDFQYSTTRRFSNNLKPGNIFEYILYAFLVN